MSRGQNKLIDKFKMAASNVISKQESKGSWQDLVWIATRRGKLLEVDRWPFILVNRLFLVSPT